MKELKDGGYKRIASDELFTDTIQELETQSTMPQEEIISMTKDIFKVKKRGSFNVNRESPVKSKRATSMSQSSSREDGSCSFPSADVVCLRRK